MYCSTDNGLSFSRRASHDPGLLFRTASATRLGSRLTRGGFHTLRVLPSGNIIAVVRGAILRLQEGAEVFDLRHRFSHGSRPLSICLTPAGDIFFGEYWDNPDRGEIRIFGSFNDGLDWEVVHTFAKSSIRHVHGIHYDPYRRGCWVLTGDHDSESQILFADTDFSRVEVVASGSQRCRAVTVIPVESGLIVPTDTEHEQNYIQWLDTESGRLDRLEAIPGTVFHSTSTRDTILLSTVVEPSKVNLSAEATIWASSDGKHWERIYSQLKDGWSPVYFQYGTFVLPVSEGSSEFAFAGGQAVIGDDQSLLRISFENTPQTK